MYEFICISIYFLCGLAFLFTGDNQLESSGAWSLVSISLLKAPKKVGEIPSIIIRARNLHKSFFKLHKKINCSIDNIFLWFSVAELLDSFLILNGRCG